MKYTFRLLCALLVAAPGPVLALGLGDIHLSSALNQPLVATIELVGAMPEELQQLRANLAPREAFTRAGLDRPAFLSGLRFKVAKDSGGRDVLEVRSADPIGEPFITMLVEVEWPRGRLIREYTVLLDPPVFETQPSAAAPLVAPRTGTPVGAAAGAITRAPAVAPAAREMAAPAAGGGEYRVVAKDTLYSIVSRSAGGAGVARADINRLMVATFRANTSAFEGNINRLHKGALLRVPALADVGALPAAEANREVARQMREWRGAHGAGTGGEGARLRLVAPAATGAAAGAAAGAAPARGAAADQQVAQLQRELAETKRLLELRSAELARLQGKPAAAPAVTAAPPIAQPTPAPAPAVKPAPAPAAKPAPGAEAPAAAVPAPKPVAKPAVKPAAAPGAAPSERGFLAPLTDNLLTVILGGVALLAAALFGFNFVRRRREQSELDEVLAPAGGASRAAYQAVRAEAARPAREEAPRPSNIVVEEADDDSGEFVAPPIARVAPKPAPAKVSKPIEDTLSSETAINLEQADPLAEADFHMAYGLYDQAADIVKLAIDRDPERRDLKLKLLEVYFVWGNKDAFLEVARDLGRGRDKAAAGEWDKVVIMGRQIAADDPLFAGAAPASGAGVDLDLESGGGDRMDLELLGEEPAAATHTMGVDLDLGKALPADGTADTGETRGPGASPLDFTLDSTAVAQAGGGTTREMRPHMDSPTVEQPGLRGAFDLEAGAEPTVETPALGTGTGNTIREKLGAELFKRSTPADATAELSLDDLGFEIDKLGASSTSLESLTITDHADDTGVAHPADAPTMLASLDERSRATLESAGQQAGEPTVRAPRGPDLDRTQETPRPSELDRTQEAPRSKAPGVDYTGTMRMTESEIASSTGTARVLGAGPLDLDLGEFGKGPDADTVEQPRRDEVRFATDIFAETGTHRAPAGLDLDVGKAPAERELTVTTRVGASDMAMSELEPVTLSEVGTKLDLARAYMDMGDPDGARSILQEVLAEGSASQKQEAQRLIQTLPG